MSEVKQTEILDLEAGSEWRFELEGDENMAVRVSRTCRPAVILRWARFYRETEGDMLAAVSCVKLNS